MRSYPRLVFKGKENNRRVLNEEEELQASSEGYESHWKPEIIEKRKGTDREILKGEDDFTEQVESEAPQALGIEFYESLKWVQLKSEAKKLEPIYKTEIVTRKTKREHILEKIGSLLNGSI